MAFVDEVELTLAAGRGGDGVVRWRREKFAPKGGPAGGNGGKGGDVYLEVVPDITALSRYQGKRKYSAEEGGDGSSSTKRGKTGADFVFQVPVGSFVTNLESKETHDCTEPGTRILVLRGGAGGKGNAVFASPTRTTPRFATSGKEGEQARFRIELRLAVDVGLIGLPNAGKSSLLNELTAARARVGAYPFTTLEPNIGMFESFLLADIPGLIEGAAEGRGLGTKFLRHIERTRLIAHCISLEHRDVMRAYDAVRHELVAYGRGLSEKPEIVILTKSDLAQDADVASARTKLARGTGRDVLVCSIHDSLSLERMSADLRLHLAKVTGH